jgi:hypothetical protein
MSVYRPTRWLLPTLLILLVVAVIVGTLLR